MAPQSTSLKPTTLVTRPLGRTRRQVTTFGLGGQASLQWTPPGVDPVAIIEKAYRAGVTYFDTSNVYGPSQTNFGAAFRRLGLVPGEGNYDPDARERIFLATKTHVRTARRPSGERFRTDFSEGMIDGMGVKTAVHDVKRSLSQMFGDGRGGYPQGAYVDCIQFHNINSMDEVDMLFAGFDDPAKAEWLGALAAMLDLRDGTNRTGLNPEHEQLVRHIGITGHWNTAAHLFAIQRDAHRLLDTLLVSINAADRECLCHQHNAIAVAEAAGMGIIGMKVFGDAAYYHKDPRFSHTDDDVYQDVGSDVLPSAPLVQYALSVPGVATAIMGIGRIDASDDPTKCQLTSNIQAAQLEVPLSEEAREEVERLLKDAGKAGTNYFQRPSIGLTPPRNVGVESDTSGRNMGRRAVRVSWDTAYAGAHAIERYDVLRDGESIGSVPHQPQYTALRFAFDDVFEDYDHDVAHAYAVRSVDTAGKSAETPPMSVRP